MKVNKINKKVFINKWQKEKKFKKILFHKFLIIINKKLKLKF